MSKDILQEGKTATEYKLSTSSNPGSRRSSIGDHSDFALGRTTVDGNSRNITGNELRGSTIVNTFLLPQVRELADSMITLDSNFTHMNFIHESLVDLNESVSALLYGLMCNSWCVDFPNLPHDTARELSIRQELSQLRVEKERLLDELRRSSKNQSTSRSGGLYRDAARSKTLEDKILPQPTVRTSLIASSFFRPAEDDEEEEEDNTAASFVSNPTMQPPKAAGVSPPVNQVSTRAKRRYSILNQIRNNDTTAHKTGAVARNFQGAMPVKRASTHPVPSASKEKRKSLAVSASRIANKRQVHSSNAIKSKNVSTKTSNSVNYASTGAAKDKATAHSSKLYSTRPPFR